MKNRNHKEQRFRKLGIITVIAVYFLILVGGIVRSTGSGMGCPDWPKCFGQWVPPTSEAQLSENYRTIFVEKRLKKNEKLAGYLELISFNDLAYQLRNDPGINEEQPFNPAKTWTEYTNRIIGVLIGLLIMGTVLASIPFINKDKAVFYLVLASLVLVILQGWTGSVVVSTNLIPGIVSFHMLMALLIVALLIYAVFRSYKDVIEIPQGISTSLKWIAGIAIFVTIFQIVLGTRVRETIDLIAVSMEYSSRELWIAKAGNIFLMHRSYSIIIVLLNTYLLVRLWNYREFPIFKTLTITLGLIIGLTVLAGVIMAYLGIPKFVQPIHLFLGTALFGIQFMVLLMVKNRVAA